MSTPSAAAHYGTSHPRTYKHSPSTSPAATSTRGNGSSTSPESDRVFYLPAISTQLNELTEHRKITCPHPRTSIPISRRKSRRPRHRCAVMGRAISTVTGIAVAESEANRLPTAKISTQQRRRDSPHEPVFAKHAVTGENPLKIGRSARCTLPRLPRITPYACGENSGKSMRACFVRAAGPCSPLVNRSRHRAPGARANVRRFASVTQTRRSGTVGGRDHGTRVVRHSDTGYRVGANKSGVLAAELVTTRPNASLRHVSPADRRFVATCVSVSAIRPISRNRARPVENTLPWL